LKSYSREKILTRALRKYSRPKSVKIARVVPLTSDFLQEITMTDLNRRDPPIRGEFDGEWATPPAPIPLEAHHAQGCQAAGEALKSPLKAIAAHERANYGPPAFRRPSAADWGVAKR
jgi:hypothetical protein